MILAVILIILATTLLFFGKSMADITQEESLWKSSIFSKYDIKSFWGSKDNTWKRKDHTNKIINWLKHNLFVFATDIWHFANLINRLGKYILIIGVFILGDCLNLNLKTVLVLLSCIITYNVIGFHICYHYILKKKK